MTQDTRCRGLADVCASATVWSLHYNLHIRSRLYTLTMIKGKRAYPLLQPRISCAVCLLGYKLIHRYQSSKKERDFMKVYGTKEIRNVGIVGHGHAGKTSLVSAMLFDAGATNRLGRVDEGTTTTDYDEDEIARKLTIISSLAYCEWNGTKINILDTPGFAAFILDAKAALRACDSALVVVDAVSGVEVQTEKAWSYADEFGIPRLIVVSKMDRERADFEQAVAGITEAFGRSAVPVQLPIGSEHDFKGVIDLIHMRSYTYEADGTGKATHGDVPAELKAAAEAAREKIIDVGAESSEALMEK